MFRCVKVLYAVLVLVAVLSWGPSAFANIRVVSELSAIYEVTPGEVYEGSIALENSGDRLETARVYQTDYWFNAEGQNRFDEPGDAERSNAGWIEIGPSQVSVPPRQRVNVVYRVRVPESEDLRGTYWSVMMIEPIPAAEQGDAGGDEETRVAIQQTIRYAIQVVTHISARPGEVAIEFANPRLVEDEGTYTFRVDIANTGERWVVPKVWMDLYRGDGTTAGHFEASERRVYPGTSARWQLDVGALAKGTYNAIVIADGGSDQVFGAQYTLEVGK